MAKKKYTDKRIRFKELAESRTNNILNELRILTHCANKFLYEYNPEEIDKIFEAIEYAVDESYQTFQNKKQDKFVL